MIRDQLDTVLIALQDPTEQSQEPSQEIDKHREAGGDLSKPGCGDFMVHNPGFLHSLCVPESKEGHLAHPPVSR